MSTGKTENLKLNQWSLSDPVLMEEFNADNRIIDKAVAPLSGRIDSTAELLSNKIETATAPLALVKLGEIMTGTDCQQLDIDFSDLDWSKYLKVIVFMSLDYGNPNESTYFFVRANNISAEETYYTAYYESSGAKANGFNFFTRGMDISNTYTQFPRFIKLEILPETEKCIVSALDQSYQRYSASGVVGALRSSAGSSTVAPISALKTINIICQTYVSQNYVPVDIHSGRIYIYGVKK